MGLRARPSVYRVTPPFMGSPAGETFEIDNDGQGREMRKTRFVENGEWTTLERRWGRTGRAVFVGPARAEIKVRYGNGRSLGKDRQRQTLDGLHARELRIGLWSLVYARLQILVPRSREVTYDFYPASS